MRAVAVLAVTALFSCAGCSSGGDEPGRAETDRFEEILALPYLDFSPAVAGAGETGVTVFDEELAAPGLIFYTNRHSCNARLIDRSGAVVREWSAGDACGRWDGGILLADGGIVVIGWDSRPQPLVLAEVDLVRHVLRLDWNGRVLWKAQVPAHHDLDVVPDGSVIAITGHMRDLPEIHQELPVRDSWLTLIAPDGVVRAQRSIYDGLASVEDFELLVPERPRGRGDDAHIELLHANAVDWFEDSELSDLDPLYAEGNVLVTMRSQNLVAIVRWRTGEVLWTWSPGEIEAPHFARLLPNGNLLVFDNGVLRGRSRVLEIDPLSNEIVSEITEGPEGPFYTPSRGAAQRLPNGNTLITVSQSGEAFEVTPSGEVVWRFFNPQTNDRDRRVTFFAVVLYGPECLDAVRSHLGRGAEPDWGACLLHSNAEDAP